LYKVIDCLKHDNPVINKKLKEVSVEEGRIIATELFQILNERKDGIGLAANQVGIDAQVAVVNVREPLILINPKIIEKWDEIPYYEGCLSFPKQGIHTKRYKSIIIQTEQEESGWYFSGVEGSEEGKGTWEQDSKKHDQEQRLLEAICVQHEIDHLNGMTIMDRENKPKPIVSKKSYSRNEIVGITNGDTYKEIKYKKAKPLLDSGEWVVYVGGPIT
jgi:peptide deformylase|tara:strand:+ start:16615 stop:17265 length:651 start_codon:yes stop_codon:yes gene_type:complete